MSKQLKRDPIDEELQAVRDDDGKAKPPEFHSIVASLTGGSQHVAIDKGLKRGGTGMFCLDPGTRCRRIAERHLRARTSSCQRT